MSTKPSLRTRLIGAGYLVVWRVTRWLPERTATRLWMASAHRSFKRNNHRRRIVAENLRPVVGDGPELDKATRGVFETAARYWMEAFRLQDLSDDQVARSVRFVGGELLDKLYADGGCVLAVPHVGNWDAAGRYVAKRWKLAVVVEVLRPRALFERFVAYRRANGMTVIPLARGSDPTAQCVKELRNGTIVALVSDRDLTGKGIEVTMFGRKAKMPAGPAVVALRARRPLCPAVTWIGSSPGTWEVHVWPPIATGNEPETPEEIGRIMQRLADHFEIMLRERPEQWLAFSPYWIA